MLKRTFPLLFLLLCNIIGYAQTVENPGTPDSLYPVTNLFSERPYINNEVFRYDNAIYKIIQKENKYLLAGDFTNIAENSGSALVVDTGFNTIFNDHKWRINGVVNTAIPDGQGGFYIGGTFTQIGDSSRLHIAQLNSQGEPTGWNPTCDSVVKVILKRNDTLFIGGAFKSFAGQQRTCFAIYKINNNSLSPYGGGSGFPLMKTINSLVLNNDTIVYAGESTEQSAPYHPIRKYNFKNHVNLVFNLSFNEFGEVKFLQLSPDKTIMIYAAHYNGEYIKGINYRFGTSVYTINISMSQFYGNNTGTVYGLKVVGNKAYAAGYFNDLIMSSTTQRRALFAFNPLTGSIYPENFNLPGYLRFLDEKDGRLFISGKFATVNGISREQFAIVDTGSLAVGNLQLAPTDFVTSIAFSGNRVFLGGVFKGIHSEKRIGLAAIDIQGKNVSPWNPITGMSLSLKECKRVFVKGDSLFILGHLAQKTANCIASVSSIFKVYSISTGAEFGVGGIPLELVNDILLDVDYLYVSYDKSLKRYSLPNLQLDLSWGTNWSMTSNKHSLNHLISDSNKIYAVGDSRFYTCFNTLNPKLGYFDVYDKVNGHTLNSYHYQRVSSDYDDVMFDHALLSGNRLYVQGFFDTLNGNPRKNFVCFNINTGAITNWRVDHNYPGVPLYHFYYTTDLKLYNGKIWFGSSPVFYPDGTGFSGFASIDTSTGSIVSQPVQIGKSDYNNNWYEGLMLHDFIINDSVLVLAGRFDTLNGRPARNFAVFHVINPNNIIQACPGNSSLVQSNMNGTTFQWQMDNGTGFADINDNSNFSGTLTANLQLINIPSSWYGYKLRCRVDAATSNVFTIKISSTWTGAINTAWELAGNWGCGTVPDANTDVFINDGNLNYPVVNSNATCRSIRANNSSSVIVITGNSLTITGKD